MIGIFQNVPFILIKMEDVIEDSSVPVHVENVLGTIIKLEKRS